MISKQLSEEESYLFPIMNGQKLRKVVSDVSIEMDKSGKELEAISKIDEVEEVECECCGLKEDCTQDYITKTKDSHHGKWVCGLCSEAVRERLVGEPVITIEEALSSHRNFCQEFNSTTRLNPKLSLTRAMRSIARRSCENRQSKNIATSKIARSTSCVPRINLNMK